MSPDERFNTDDILWLRRPDDLVESSQVERKETFDPPTVAKTISAFANSDRAGGLIVLGASKDGKLPGLTRAQVEKDLSSLDQSVELVPGWSVQHRVVPLEGDGDAVLLFIRVPFSPRRVVQTSSRKAFRRRGSTSVELTSDQLLELRRTTLELPFEDEPCIPFSEDALDVELASEFQSKVAAHQTIENPLVFDLRLKHLVVTHNGADYLSTAGVLVLGRDPLANFPMARVRVTRFDGIEERTGADRNVVKEAFFDAPLPRLIPALRSFVESQLREFDFLGPQGAFVAMPEYPAAAWQEAVVNAVVHRSYSLQRFVAVRIFDDRFEVVSPGGFPGNVSADNLVSQPRNPHLAEALRLFSFVRLAQEGTRRIVEEMKQAQLPAPSFKESIHRDEVRVVLLNDVTRRLAEAKRDPHEPKWRSIEADLADTLVLIRTKALQRWRALVPNGSPPPLVIERAIGRLGEPSLGVTERRLLLEALADTNGLEARARQEVVRRCLNDAEWAGDVETVRLAIRLGRDSPACIEDATRWFETRWRIETPSAPNPQQVVFAVTLLTDVLRYSAELDRTLVVRILKASRQYSADTVPGLRALQELIEG